MCVGAPAELLASHTWYRFSDHKIFLLFQGKKKILRFSKQSKSS